MGDDIHQAANGAIAVKQGRGALQDFNLVGRQSFDADRVVGRQS